MAIRISAPAALAVAAFGVMLRLPADFDQRLGPGGHPAERAHVGDHRDGVHVGEPDIIGLGVFLDGQDDPAVAVDRRF